MSYGWVKDNFIKGKGLKNLKLKFKTTLFFNTG